MPVSRRSYSTDLTDAEWQILEPLLPAEKPGGRHRLYELREIINALRYLLRTGCSWRLIPHDAPALASGLRILQSLERRRDMAENSRLFSCRVARADGARQTTIGSNR